MNEIEKLFFEGQCKREQSQACLNSAECSLSSIFYQLIRVAIGTQETLSRLPKETEWGELFDMAVKQSLVGICFVGVHTLGADSDEGYVQIGMSGDLFFDWMGMAAQINMKNDVVNEQCVKLQKRLSADGLRSCLLKGQGVATLYGEELRGFRQSGDIDLWVDAPKKDVVDWAMNVGMTEKPGYLHVGASCFEDTAVELHYRPTYLRSFSHNRRLQQFCESHKGDWTERNGMTVPSWEFEVVYQLSHIYRHLFGLGVGLRQLMDYYFVLRASNSNSNENLKRTLSLLGLYNFAEAVMYVMREVFGLDERYMICPVDEKRGQMLLKLVMQTGNFGHLDEKQKAARCTTAGSFKYKLRQWWELVRFYPEETLSAPLWRVINQWM